MRDQRERPGTLLQRQPAIVGAPPSRRRQPVRAFPSPRERTRSRNVDRYSRSPSPTIELAFRCECARPECDVRLPLGVERHRRWRDRFIVAVAHGDGDTVVGVADHFLVVEANDRRPSLYPLPAPAAVRHSDVSAA